MARGVNKVILVGNLGNDPDVKYTQAGMTITTISIATSESWKDKETGEKMERTEWHRVKFFGKLADIAGEYLTKGGQVYVEGSIRTEKYTDKNGIERYATDVIANVMQMLGSRGDGDGQRTQRAPARQQSGQRAPARQQQAPRRQAAPAQQPPMEDFDDDDIPF